MPRIAPTGAAPRDDPAAVRLMSSPAGALLEVDGRPLADVLAAQPRFATQRGRDGAISLVPVTAAAATYVATPAGSATVDRLGRLAQAVEQRSGRRLDLDGIALATSRAGRRASLVASDVANGNLALPPRRSAPSDDWFDEAAITLQEAGDGRFSSYGTGWVTIDPASARTLRALSTPRSARAIAPADARDSVMMLWHELEHAATPTGGAASRRLGDLEEGIASTLTNWPGTARVAREATGFDIPAAGPTPTYHAETAAVRGLLRLAGVDTRRAGDAGKAVELLQSGSLTRVPGKLADAIVAARGLDPAVREPLRQRIARGGADPAAVRRLLNGLAGTA